MVAKCFRDPKKTPHSIRVIAEREEFSEADWDKERKDDLDTILVTRIVDKNKVNHQTFYIQSKLVTRTN